MYLNLYTSVFGCVCGFGFEQKFWRIDGFGEKKTRIGGFAYLYSPPSKQLTSTSGDPLTFHDILTFNRRNTRAFAFVSHANISSRRRSLAFEFGGI